jgi:hypothetical protein
MHTASMMAMVANIAKASKSKSYTYKDFYPFSTPKVPRGDVPKVGIEVLKSVFVDHKMPNVEHQMR